MPGGGGGGLNPPGRMIAGGVSNGDWGGAGPGIASSRSPFINPIAVLKGAGTSVMYPMAPPEAAAPPTAPLKPAIAAALPGAPNVAA